MAVLDTCTEAQRRRFLLYALDGLSLAEIGVLCGCSKAVSYTHLDVYKRQQYTCSNYTKVPCGTLCPTQHRINESAVLTLVSDSHFGRGDGEQ